jgi:hypothetical protein
MEIKKMYKVKVVKYNFDDPCYSFTKRFENYPSDQDIEDTLIKCNNENPQLLHYYTEIFIKEFYVVIR